jgi:lipoprotein-anchoring transpeptidase ErfK/SrfK
MAGAAEAASGVPCGVSDGACVALGKSGYNATAWMVRGGRIVRGPVSALTGGPGADTPTGTFRVTSKDRDHISSATTDAAGRPSPMPYSVFFGSNGVAFHGTQSGDNSKNRTAGCVRLPNGDASYFFNNLRVGDTVQVVNGDGDYSSKGRGRDRDDDRDSGGGVLGGVF